MDAHGYGELKREETFTSNMNEVIEEIFHKCDTEGTGFVLTLALVDFVAKYFNNCRNDWRILELKNSLDPDGTNRPIDKATFSTVWMEWVEKVKSDDRSILQDSFKSCNGGPSKTGLELGQIDSKSCDDSSTSSSSQASPLILQTSINGDNANYEEQIKELNHLNRKLAEEVSILKSQLSNSEEHNESLQKSLDLALKKYHMEQQKLEEYRTLQEELVRLQEEPEATKKQLECVQKQLMQQKKDVQQKLVKISELENEKKNLEDANEDLNTKLQQAAVDLIKMETELGLKDQEAGQLLKETYKLKEALSEMENNIQYFKNESEKQKVEKLLLEKHLKKDDLRGTLLKQLTNKKTTCSTQTQLNCENESTAVPFTPPIQNEKFKFFNLDSPFTRVTKDQKKFNSPNLLKMIAEPIEPLDSDVDNTSANSVDSSNFERGLISKSTPLVANRAILDSSIPEIDSPILNPVPHNSENNVFDYNQSPPCLYVIERTNIVDKKPEEDMNGHEDQNVLQDTSSEQDLFWKLQLSASPGKHESLHEEILHASNLDEENKSFNIKCEHCVYYINKQKEEISQLEISHTQSAEKLITLEKKMSDLKIELSIQHETNAILNQENANLKELLASSQNTVSGLQQKQNELKSDLQKFANEDREREKILEENTQKYLIILELQKSIEDLEGQLKDEIKIRSEENSKLNDIINKLRSENEEYQRVTNNLRAQNSSLSKDAQSAEDINELFNDKIKDLLENEENLKTNLNCLADENARLRDELSHIENIREQIMFLKDEMRCKEDALKEKQFECESTARMWMEKYEVTSKKCDELRIGYEELQRRSESETENLKTEINTLKLNVSDKESSIHEMTYDVKTLKDANKTLQRENKKMIKQLRLLQNLNEDKEKQLEVFGLEKGGYVKSIQEMNDRISELLKKEDDHKKEIDMLHNSYKKKDADYLNVKESFECLTNSDKELQDQYYNLKEKLDKTLQDSLSYTNENESLKNQLNLIRTELSGVKSTLRQKEELIQKINIDKDSFTKELTDLKNKNDSLEILNKTNEEVIEKLNNNMHDALDDLNSIELKTKLREESLCLQCQQLVETQEEVAFLEHVNLSLRKENEELKGLIESSSETLECKNCDSLKEQMLALQDKYQNQLGKCSTIDKTSNKTCSYNKLEMLNNRLERKIERLQEELRSAITKLEESSSNQNLETNKLMEDKKEMENRLSECNEELTLVKNENVKLKETISELENLQIELSQARDELDSSNNDRTKIALKLESTERSLASLNNSVDIVRKTLSDRLNDLERSTNSFMESWKEQLQNTPNGRQLLKDLDECGVSLCGTIDTVILSTELIHLNKNVFFITNLFNNLVEMRNVPSVEKLCMSCANIIDIPSILEGEQKVNVRKPILRAPALTLPSRPDSPDSPCVEISQNTKACQTDERVDEEPSLTKIQEINVGTDQMVTQASPKFTESFRENLHHHEGFTCELSEEDLEQRYDQIISAFAIDRSTLTARIQKVDDLFKKLEKKIAEEGSWAYRLIDDLVDPRILTAQQVDTLRDCIRKILNVASELSVSADLLGALKHERKVLQSFNIIINYVSCLQKNSISYSQLRRSINCSLNNHMEGDDLWYENFFIENANGFVNIGTKLKENGSSVCSVCSSIISEKTSVPKLVFFKSVKYSMYTFMSLMFVLFVFIFILIGVELKHSRRGYPSLLETWIDYLSPYVKKEYPYGPPPV